jgi:FkbM family methyltransferase
MLAWLTKLLENTTTPIGSVVHIGAGVGNELTVYQELNCEHILAVEPDESLFKKLKTKAKRFDNVTALQSWIADTAAERSATLFANPRFNSLLPANKMLLEHFPNVKTTKALKVKTESFDNLVTCNVKRVDKKSNVLVLEVQGFETALFKNSKPSTLQVFNWIVVRASEESLFECGATAVEVQQSLMAQGFELRLSDTRQLPFVEQYYQLNASKAELERVKDQLVITNNQLVSQTQKLADNNQLVAQRDLLNAQLEEKLNASSSQSNTLQTSFSELQNELKSYKENNNQLELAVEKYQQELQEKTIYIERQNEQTVTYTEFKKKTDDELNSATANNVELKQQITNFELSKQENVSQIAVLKNKLAELTAQLDGVKTELEASYISVKEQTHWHQENKKWAENLNQQCISLKEQVNERQKSNDLTLMLQIKAQVDLDDLREKYQFKNHNEQKLVELVKELRQKLQQAAEFYNYLQDEYPELSEVETLQSNSLEKNNLNQKTENKVTIPKTGKLKSLDKS